MRLGTIVLGIVVWLGTLGVGSAREMTHAELAAHGFGPGPAAIEGDNGYLGVYADLAHTSTCATIPQGSVGTLYLFVNLNPNTLPAFTGAEFRIEVTHPEGYQFLYNAPANSLTLGTLLDLTPNDPFDRSGINLAFTSCRGPGPVAAGTITILNLTGGPTEFLVKRANGPTNPSSNAPLLIGCQPSFLQYSMTPCAVDATGGAIASRLSLNDPACIDGHECPASCASAPCVNLSALASAHPCAGKPLTITAAAENCSQTPEDIDVYVAYGLAGSFTNVAPGQAVVASRTYTLPSCEIGLFDRPPVGVVLRNAACPTPTGREIAVDIRCEAAFCESNHPPDCSHAVASVPDLWPPDGRLVSEKITGITDPDGDPVNYSIDVVSTDEITGIQGSPTCPDAFLDTSTSIRLRAERATDGDGRVYLLTVQAADPSGAECDVVVPVTVPRKPGVPAVGDGFQYLATNCDEATGDRRGRPLFAVQSIAGGGAEARFNSAAESEALLEVYDIRGRRVATVLHGRFAAGEHVARWDGRDASGVDVATGLYLFRLVAGGSVSTAKVVLVH